MINEKIFNANENNYIVDIYYARVQITHYRHGKSLILLKH